MSAAPHAGVPNRLFITIAIMAAALMQTLDTTIANVALPHIQGSVSASLDQIVWVLTFYIVGAAIMTPLTGWLAEKVGRKTLFLFSVAGFTLASALCGAAQSLTQIVAFRFIQGVAGAALMPLAQSVLLDINPPEKFGQAMATFAMAVVLGPILGPTLGGWLTDNFSWRWVFYINLPLGCLSFLVAWLFLPGKPHPDAPKFDFFGYGTLAVGLGALQLMLDRGPTNDWFGSSETWIEAVTAVLCCYLCVIHLATAGNPLFPRALWKDRNFRTTLVVSVVVIGAMYASMALVPPMLQNLYGYPVFAAGLIIMPRGIGGFISMAITGRLTSRIDARLLMAGGVVLLAASFFIMSRFAPDQGAMPMIFSGFVQGLSLGLVFVPISTLGFATLPGHLRVQGATVSNLIRSVGGSIGISVLQVLLSRNMQVSWTGLTGGLWPENTLLHPLMPGGQPTPAGIATLTGMVAKQAAFIAYIDDFWLMTIATLAILPVLLLLRPAPRTARAEIPLE